MSLIDDNILSIALSADSLDDIIDISLTSSNINQQLKSDRMIQLIQNRLGIDRPIVTTGCDDISQWDELIRENSKIHATKYARVNYGKSSDYPTMSTLVHNALVENTYVNKYYQHITINDYQYATDIDTIDRLFADLVPTTKPDKYGSGIVLIDPQCKDKNGQFLPDVFLHYIDVIIPRYFSLPTKFMINDIPMHIHVRLESAVKLLLSQDIPLDTIFASYTFTDSDEIHDIRRNYTFVTHVGTSTTLDLNHAFIGPNNFKYINPMSHSLLLNPHTEMVAQLLSSGQLTIGQFDTYSSINAFTVNGVRPGLHVVQYMYQHGYYNDINDLIYTAVSVNNLHIAQYLMSVYQEPLQLPSFMSLISFAPLDNREPFTVDDIKHILGWYGENALQFLHILSIDSVGDRPAVYQYLVDQKIPSSYFNSRWNTEVLNDNVRCLSIIYRQMESDVRRKLFLELTVNQQCRMIRQLALTSQY